MTARPPHIYFAVSPREDEFEALRRAKPQRVLLSFALWRKKSVQYLIDNIGYRPDCIILDSGAYTFHNKSINTGLCEIIHCFTANDDFGEMSDEDIGEAVYEAIHRYGFYNAEDAGGILDMNPFVEFYLFWEKNYQLIDYVITMDTIGKASLTFTAWRMLDAMGMCPLPVFGYGECLLELEKLVAAGANYIALGGSAFVKSRRQRVIWASAITEKYPKVDFHLLGTQDRYVLDRVPGLWSADGTAWLTSASFRRDRRPGQSKVDMAVENILRLMAG